MMMPGRKFAAGSGYRYGFNGKEKDNDINVGGQDYGKRVYDLRLGRFMSIDPITAKYPNLTPYQFASNTPMHAIDLDGMERFDVVTTSFAPFNIFANDFFGGYYGDGDNRTFGGAPFSLSGDIGKYRTMGYVGVDMSNTSANLVGHAGSTTSTYHRASWNPLSDYTATSPTHIAFENQAKYTKNSLSFDFHTYGSDQAIAFSKYPVVPNIDDHVSISITKVGATKLNVYGSVSGDRFPSNETYLKDEKGTVIMLGVTGAGGGREAPYYMLWGDLKQPMSTFRFDIELNSDNSFKGVQLKDKFYTPAEWNKQFSNQDTKDASGTTTGDSQVLNQPFEYAEE